MIPTDIKHGTAVEFTTMMRQSFKRAGIFLRFKESTRGLFAVIRAEDDKEVTTRPSLVQLADPAAA